MRTIVSFYELKGFKNMVERDNILKFCINVNWFSFLCKSDRLCENSIRIFNSCVCGFHGMVVRIGNF
jgi:hypothetical protein